MTIDQALEIGARARSCRIVWRTDTGEIVSVTPLGRFDGLFSRADPFERHERHPYPTMERAIERKNLTRELLEEQAGEMAWRRDRVRMFQDLAEQPTEALLGILEKQDFPPPMDRHHGSDFIIEHLFHRRRGQLTGDVLSRLCCLADEGMASQPPPSDEIFAECEDPEHGGLPPAPARRLTHYVAALAGDTARLKSFWMEDHPANRTIRDRMTLMECFGFLRVSDPEVIRGLIEVVETPFFFGPRHRAMLTLGQIGPAARARAVQAIREAIYDSSPEITAQRERVCERILTPETEWNQCTACHYGLVPSISYGIPSERPCPECLGLGVVRTGKTGHEPGAVG